jgi:hypothetical protein
VASNEAINKDVLNIEPRQQYLNAILIPQIRLCENLIYNNAGDSRRMAIAVPSCRGLIATLDKPSKEKLAEQLEILREWQVNPDGNRTFGRRNDGVPVLTQLNLELVFDSIMDYLNSTYLLDVNVHIVPSSTLKSQKDRPSGEKTPATLSAKL